LNCFGNTLSSLDVSNNIALKALYCSDTQLASLDVSKNLALTALYCSDNTLTTLDVSNNIALTELDCNKNTLTTLDVSKNTALTDLDCYNNTLTTLDVSKNTDLYFLNCSYNTITTLDISNNIALKTLYCNGIQLASIDVSKNTSLTEFNCYNNTLTALDVSNNKALVSLDCSNNTLATLDLRNGKNTALKTFLVTNNPNLYCIRVDDVAWATDNWKSIDSHATFNINCFENYFQAIFKTDTLIGETPLPVKFLDQSSGKPTTWFWEFGDGIKATMQHTEHNFTKPGNYTVRLRVTKDADTSYYSQKITALWPAAVREKINPFAGKARSGAVSFVIDTMAYVGLGRDADSCFADMWQFNPLTDTWTDVAPFPGKARSGAVAFVLNTEVYVGLGENQVSSTLYNDFYSYNPKENTWKQVADFGGTARSNAVAFAIGDTAYVGTGSDSEGATKNFWKYTPNTNQWTEIAGFSGDARSGAVGFEIDGKGYVSGGQDYGFQLSDVQEYNPETGKWIEKVFADANLTFNRATAISEGKTAFICYGDKKKVVSYTPHTNKIEDLGDVLNFEDVREDAVSFFLYGAAYFGLGVTYGDFSDNYAAHYKNDIQHIDLPFVFAPEDILLSNDTLAENSEYGTVIGTFRTVDKTEVDSFTYEITEGFNLFVEKDELKDMGSNYEIDSVYYITVKTTDSEGFTFEKAFTIKVKDINEAPWKLEIVGDTVLSGAPIGTPVGKFKAYDEDTTDTHIFRFDAARSDIDTTFYNIIGDSLLVAGTINKDDLMHDFYVLAIDKGGLELSQQIFIDIIEGVGIRMVESAVNLFDIYPNPVGDVLTIQSKNHEQIITELVLVNAMGKVVSKTEKVYATNHSLRTASMKPGIYFLMVRTEQGTYMQKIVKE
jgi:PKD repeat protein